jgi:diphthamide synthase (EF-2-diphthine--ammonia ligase)
MRTCKNCLLPESVPASDIDEAGICRPCREYEKSDKTLGEKKRVEWERDLERTLRETRGKGEYDCLVALSGGKDSTYLLYRLRVEYKLRVLAFVTNMNVPAPAWENIQKTIKKLDADLLVYTPPSEFYDRFFRYLLRNQEERGAVRTVCYVCAPLFEGYALKAAVEKQIPLVFAGYSPGQPDPERMEYEFSRRAICDHDWTPAILRESGLFSEDDLKRFWNPHVYPEGTELPRYIAPFHAWRYDQAEVMKRVVELGLVPSAKNANPVHSNCPVNWLLMYSDLKNLGYNPYNPEFSTLIREGKASKAQWQLMIPAVNFMIRHQVMLGRNVQRSLRRLELHPSELKITRKPVAEWGDAE